MARYFLHLHECGTVTRDETGVELATEAEAYKQATVAARDVMSHEVKYGTLCLSCCIVIEDADNHEIGRVTFRDALQLSGMQASARH